MRFRASSPAVKKGRTVTTRKRKLLSPFTGLLAVATFLVLEVLTLFASR